MHMLIFFFSSRRRHTRFDCDWSSDVCSSDLPDTEQQLLAYFSKPPVTYDSKGNIKSYGFSLLNPLRVDENGNGDFLDNYLGKATPDWQGRSEEHTSELQSQSNLVCRLLLEKKKKNQHCY